LKITSLVLLAAAPQPVHAADTPSFDAKRLAQDVQVLSSDAYEGRAVATPGEAKTVPPNLRKISHN
jgi:hypothetical protein